MTFGALSLKGSAKLRLRYMPSGRMPISASESTSGRSGTFALSITAVTFPPFAISPVCPMRPKPVTSVMLCTSYFPAISLPARLSSAICATALA